MTENEKKFIIGLEKLSRETGIVIAGCGCCGSPYLSDLEGDEPESGYGCSGGADVSWLSPENYHWEEYKHTIVKR